VPIKSLEFLLTKHKDITFISNFTVSPENENVEDYLNNFSSTLLKNNKCKLLVSGRLLGTKPNISNSNIKTFESTKDLIDHINNEK
jgi:hypothetical protein